VLPFRPECATSNFSLAGSASPLILSPFHST